MMEESPDEFFRWKNEDFWLSMVQTVAEFIGSDPQNVVFVQNTTTGINAVIRSLNFEKGDGIIINSWTYGNVKNICTYAADTRHVDLYYVDIPFPLKSVDQILTAYEEKLSKHRNIKLAIVDYISSMPPALMPVKEMIALCRKYDTLVLIDGAHTPGQLPLHLDQLGADFYAGNLHKWAFAPRGSAVLWIRPEFHHTIFPVVTSYYDKEVVYRNFFYQGTGDNSTYYSSAEALKFYQEIGGYDKISEYCSKLALDAANLLVKKWKTSLYPMPDDMLPPFMRLIRMPDCKEFPTFKTSTDVYRDFCRDNMSLMKTVWERFHIQSVFISIHGQSWCRISASVYNEIEDYEKLADAILTLLGEEKC